MLGLRRLQVLQLGRLRCWLRNHCLQPLYQMASVAPHAAATMYAASKHPSHSMHHTRSFALLAVTARQHQTSRPALFRNPIKRNAAQQHDLLLPRPAARRRLRHRLSVLITTQVLLNALCHTHSMHNAAPSAAALPCSAPLPGKRLTLNFKGPLITAHNSKSYREVQVAKLALPADPTDPDVLSPEGQAFTETSGLYAAGPTLLRLRRSGTFTNNTKGALYLSAKSSAQFLGAVALDRSSDAYKAGMVLVNSSASFAGPLSCSFAAPWPDANTSDSAAERYGVVSHGGCISAAGSTVVFNKQVAFLRRPGPGDFSSDVGLACSYSNIQFKGSGNFEGGAGIMWKLEACNVAAEQAVAFKNSQDSEGRQPAVMASSGNLLFKAGLAVSGNAAGGLVVKDKQRLIIQGPSMTCYNNSGTGAKYSGSHGACLYAGGKSVVVWQTATGCVQGNSCVDDTQCSTFECQPPGFPRMNATCGALFIEEDSTIDFGTSRIAFGNNTRLTPDGQMVEADIIVLAPGYQQTSADGFSCASGLKRGIGEYAIHGEVCAPGCTGAVCSCPQGTQWSAAACQCA